MRRHAVVLVVVTLLLSGCSPAKKDDAPVSRDNVVNPSAAAVADPTPIADWRAANKVELPSLSNAISDAKLTCKELKRAAKLDSKHLESLPEGVSAALAKAVGLEIDLAKVCVVENTSTFYYALATLYIAQDLIDRAVIVESGLTDPGMSKQTTAKIAELQDLAGAVTAPPVGSPTRNSTDSKAPTNQNGTAGACQDLLTSMAQEGLDYTSTEDLVPYPNSLCP